MSRRAVVVSYRLGGADGVAEEARKWSAALGALGFSVRRVAGTLEDGVGPGDVEIPELAIVPGRSDGPDAEVVTSALGDDELVVVENLCSLPLRAGASRAVADALAGHAARVLFHHHDLPWERDAYGSITDLPPRVPGAVHVSVSRHAREALRARGIDATCIHNCFEPRPTPGDRRATRGAFGFEDDDCVVLLPARAIPRKNVPGALAYAGALDALLPARVRVWLTGPPEDGYEVQLRRLVRRAPVPVTVGRACTAADAYAAADAVVVASTWEGFGNAVVEGVLAGRPVVANEYPVLRELRGGLELFAFDRPEELAEWLRCPDPDRLARGARAARRRFSVEQLPDRIAHTFQRAGWETW